MARNSDPPSLEQQDEAIIEHENVLLESIQNALLILLPIKPDPDAIFFPHRVPLVVSPQAISIKTPISYESILIQKILMGYPNGGAPNTLGPTLKMKWGGTDRKWIDVDIKNQVLTGLPQGADIRLFTSPGTTGDPATAGVLTQFASSIPLNILIPPETVVQLIIEGFDGVNPAFVDIMLVCRGFQNQRARARFWQG